MLPEAAKDLSDNLPVPGKVRVCDEDVVKVYHDIARQDEILEDVIHHSLEGRRGVSQAKVHHQRLKEAPVRPECSFPLVAFSDADIVKAPPDVEFREESGSFQSINKVVDPRKWVPVLDGHRIECPVVLNKPEGPVFLLDKEDWRCHGGLGWPDPASRQSLFDEGVQLSLFEGRDWVDLTVGRLRVRNELDSVVPCPAFWERVERFLVKDRFEVAHPLRKPILTGCRVLSMCFRQPLRNGTGGTDVFWRKE